MFSIVTPVQTNPQNILCLQSSIDFAHVFVWVIVVGASSALPNEFQPNLLTRVVSAARDSSSGNMLRNVGLQHVPLTPGKLNYVYMLDDDNVIHPRFWSVMPSEIRNKRRRVYTFGTCRFGRYFSGAPCTVNHIDTGQFIVSREVASNWTMEYAADGLYISSKCRAHGRKHIPMILAYYNALKPGFRACPKAPRFQCKLTPPQAHEEPAKQETQA